MGLETFVALVANGATFGASAVATWGIAGTAAIQLAGSLVASAARGLFAQRPSQQEVKRDLTFPTSRPPYRFPYGRGRVPATPIPYPVVGDYAYACWLVSSRATEGPFTVWMDNREVTLTGDPYDFTATGGATATVFPFLDHLTIWIGRGDQVQPPQVFLDEAGYVENGDDLLWRPTDAGQGCTIVWARMKAGRNGQRAERWPAATPALELEGRFSRLWDPRDAAQSLSDPATWEWSDNAALCALDVLTQNPFRPYEARNIAVQMWADYADAADEIVPLKSGGSEPRFVTSGVVVFDGAVLEQLMQPVLACGGARMVQMGGQRGVVAAVPRTPLSAITESLGGLSYSGLLDDADLVTELRVNYSPSERGGEAAELAPWSIPGALAADGGQPSVKTLDLSMVGSATQAQRLRNIAGKQARLQKTVQLVAPPKALEAVGGSVLPLGLPAPYGARVNSLYEVGTIGAAVHIQSKDGVAMRCPVSLREYSDAVFDWDPFTDEEDIVHAVYDSQRDGLSAPGALSVTSGAGVDLDTGGAIVPRFLLEFAPSVSLSVEYYQWEWRLTGGYYQSGGTASGETFNAAGRAFFYLPVSDVATGHDVRVRAVSPSGTSVWVELTGAFYDFALLGVTGTPAPGQATFAGTGVDSSSFAGVRVWRADDGLAFGDAVPITDVVPVARATPFSVTVGAPALMSDNTGFDTAADWLLTEFAIAGGVASKTSAANGRVQLAPVLVEGAAYRITFRVTAYTSGTVRAFISGSGIASGVIAMGVGEYSARVIAPAVPTRIGLLALGGFVGDVDDLFIFPDDAPALDYGDGEYFVTPVTLTGAEAAPFGPIPLNIP